MIYDDSLIGMRGKLPELYAKYYSSLEFVVVENTTKVCLIDLGIGKIKMPVLFVKDWILSNDK